MAILITGGACGRNGASVDQGIALYYAGQAVPLARSHAKRLREQFTDFFYSCGGPYQAVTGREWPQDDLTELWNNRELGSHALLTAPPLRDSPFAHLRGRDFTVLFGLDPESGVGQVLTKHDGVVTPYIKCPGFGGMVLTCDLLSTIPGRQSWPICGRVEQLRKQLETETGRDAR